MRTSSARRVRNKALMRSVLSGHDPILVTKSGAMELWVCQNCDALIDCWDSPAIVNGPMQFTTCPERKLGRLRSAWAAVALIISNVIRGSEDDAV